MTCNEVMATREPRHLTIFSILTRSTGSILLLSPHQPSYWSAICVNPEWRSGTPDPVYRWSHWTIETLAQATRSKPHFRFGGLSAYSSRAPWTTTCHGKALSDWPYQVEAGPLVSYRSALNIKRVIHCSRRESP